MSDRAPRVATIQARMNALGVAVDATEELAVAPFDGNITRVAYIPDTTLTGANTNSRTLTLVNKGATGAGSTTAATLAFTAGVNATANDETDLALSGTAANLVVASGDVLAFVSTHVGTGIADPGGLVQVDITSS
jgi:hypothetical protein